VGSVQGGLKSALGWGQEYGMKVRIRNRVGEGFEVIPVPGTTALATALAASGMDTARFSFEGLLSSRWPVYFTVKYNILIIRTMI